MKTSMFRTRAVLKTRIKAFAFAWNGLRSAFLYEQPFRIHTIFFCIAIVSGTFLHLSTFEWALVLVCSGFVLACELFNSAVETICDLVIPHKHEKVKYIKDISAGAVLISAVAAVSVAALIVSQRMATIQH